MTRICADKATFDPMGFHFTLSQRRGARRAFLCGLVPLSDPTGSLTLFPFHAKMRAEENTVANGVGSVVFLFSRRDVEPAETCFADFLCGFVPWCDKQKFTMDMQSVAPIRVAFVAIRGEKQFRSDGVYDPVSIRTDLPRRAKHRYKRCWIGSIFILSQRRQARRAFLCGLVAWCEKKKFAMDMKV